MKYTDNRTYYDTLAWTFPQKEAKIVNLKFTDAPYNTRGFVNLLPITKDFAFYKSDKLIEKDGKMVYQWRDAAIDKHVITIEFETGKYGLWVKLPQKIKRRPKVANGQPVLKKDGTPEWEDDLTADGKKQYVNTTRFEGFNGSWRNDTLKTIIAAAIEVKAGRFSYHVPCTEDHFFAWRKCNKDNGEESESGNIGVHKDEIDKLRAAGIKVLTGTSLVSCANCQHCYTRFELDDDSDAEVEQLGSRPVSELSANGQLQPSKTCMLRNIAVDIDAVDEVNELLRFDYTNELSPYGYRMGVSQNEVVVNKFVRGPRKVLVSQTLNGEGEDAMPEKVYEEIDVEGSERTKMSAQDLVAELMTDTASECPMYTRYDKRSNFYARLDTTRCAVLRLDGKVWEWCPDDATAKKAGKAWKFAIRAQGLQVSYIKKTPLEKQRDFLKKFDNWVLGGCPLDTDDAGDFLNKFESEEPKKSVTDQWHSAANKLIVELRPFVDQDEGLGERLDALETKIHG